MKTPAHVAPLKLSAFGMDERALNMFRLFLGGPGDNRAVLVNDPGEAEALLIDLDSVQGKALFARQRELYPTQPCIVLALRPTPVAGDCIFVQKPAQGEHMLLAIEQARGLIGQEPVPYPGFSNTAGKGSQRMPVKVVKAEKTESHTHQVAMRMDEQAFFGYLGRRSDIDPSDPLQVASLYYDPDHYLQGLFQKVCLQALTLGEPVRVPTPWLPITMLPRHRKVWVDADEAQLRAACAVRLHYLSSSVLGATSLTLDRAVELPEEEADRLATDPKAMPIATFLWKVALWTSKGLVPRGIDLNHKVRLIRWPNFTRLAVIPHALRVAALLHQAPHTIFEAARVLGVRQQIVAAFCSASWALGLVELQPSSEPEYQPEAVESAPRPAQAEKTSLLKSILQRLKMI